MFWCKNKSIDWYDVPLAIRRDKIAKELNYHRKFKLHTIEVLRREKQHATETITMLRKEVEMYKLFIGNNYPSKD